MSKIICYTFNEYQSKYPKLLKNYLDEYIDNTDLLFWNEQKDFYNECIKNVTLEKTNKGFDKLKAPFEPLSISIEEIHYTINESMSVVDNKNVKHSVTNENKVKYDNAIKSFSKILEFIQNQILETEQAPIQLQPLQKLNWQGTTLEFTELFKSLILSNKLNPELTQTEIFSRLKNLFNINDFKETDKLRDIRKRTNTPTPFLNILETSLNNWIEEKD
ncbi:RteC domain-containing protein [Flavobacterium psychrophilum]|uniref:RteC domain-containing protein n=1 Tax=Flavobacterium psychrophilum TaxID=96345 RepID=UPI0039854ECF